MMKAKIKVCTIIFLGIFLGSWHINAQEPISANTAQTQTDSISNKNQEPGIDDFIQVEKEPSIDLNRLTSLVYYPEEARLAGVEGKVVIRVLVNKDGSLRKIMVEYSDNALLNESAKCAVKKYGRFEPAIQKGKPIACWVSIPIEYKLRGSDGKPKEQKKIKSNGQKKSRTLWDLIFG